MALFKKDNSISTIFVPRYNVQVKVNVYRATYIISSNCSNPF